MANALYVSGKNGFLTGAINLSSDDIRCVLIDAADYTVNLSTHDNLDDIPAPARVATSTALSSKTVTGGVFDAADKTISSVTGDQAEAIVIYKHTGTESTSTLIAYIDTGTNIPVTPTGSDIVIQWNASGIFGL